MVVKDVVDVLNPWQDLTVRNEDDTQLNEPLFMRWMNECTIPDDEIMAMPVVGMDASLNTIVLYVRS